MADRQNILIDISKIYVGDRIGFYWPVKAEVIGGLIAADGQKDAIKVAKYQGGDKQFPWKLITGLHRLRGMEMHDLTQIWAEIVEGTPEHLRQIEASENMHRRAFEPLERAAFVRALADAAEARIFEEHGGKSQQQIAVESRWSKEKDLVQHSDIEKSEMEAEHTGVIMSRVYGWRDGIAQSMGLSLAAIKRDLALHRTIIKPFPEEAEKLAKSWCFSDNASELRKIAAIANVDERREVMFLLTKYPAMTVDGAKSELGLKSVKATAATGQSKFMENATANLGRLSAASQISLAPAIADTIKPSALLALRDAIDNRIKHNG